MFACQRVGNKSHKKSGTSILSEMSRGLVWGMLSTLSDPFTELPKNLASLSRAQNERKPFKKSRLLWQQLCHQIIRRSNGTLNVSDRNFWLEWAREDTLVQHLEGEWSSSSFKAHTCCLFSAVSPAAWGSSWVCNGSTSPKPSSSSSKSYGQVCVFSSLMKDPASSGQPCNQSQMH